MTAQQNLSVSAISIVFMSISILLSVFVPIAAMIFMGVKKRLNTKALFFGVIFFILFSRVLENLMHVLVLGGNPTQSLVYRNVALYMAYGGFAAGIFEEAARLVGFRYILRVREGESLDTGISYGLGHGGCESLLIGGLTSVSYLITSAMWNGGLLKGMSTTLNEQQLSSFNQAIGVVTGSSPGIFLLVGVERLIAVALQIGLSLFVFKAAAERKWQYFLYAVLIHAGVDIIAVAAQRGLIKSMFLLEAIIFVITVAVVFLSIRINRRRGWEKPGQAGTDAAAGGADASAASKEAERTDEK